MNNLWMFNQKDNSIEKPTWKYLDHRATSKKGLIWCQNPNFAYQHLSPFDENSMQFEEFNKIEQ